MLFALLMAVALPFASSPEAEGVSSRQVLSWIDACERDIDALHGFVLLKNGKRVAEGSWAPFDTLNKPHRLSSHSKCFVTTAVGMLVDEHRLDLDECVADIFPELLPPNPSDNLKRMRVRDLLTMNVGSKPSCGWFEKDARDWYRAFLAKPVTKRPGNCFNYDSDATHVLGAVIARKSGMRFEDFMRKRVFAPLGITSFWTTYDPMGNPCAGYGFNMTTREISHIDQLYLDRGEWNGRRLISADWAVLATTKQTWSGKTVDEFWPDNDWLYGFGFNWWRCQHGCFRADGAGGQYTIVFPEHRAVLSIHADVYNMQQALDMVWKHFLPALSQSALPEDPYSAAALKARCSKLALKPVPGGRGGADRYLGKTYVFKNGHNCISSVRLDETEDGLMLKLATEAGVFDLPVGVGEWKTGEAVFSPRTYEVLGELVGRQRVAVSGGVQDDRVRIRIVPMVGARKLDLTFRRKFFRTAVDLDRQGAVVTSGLE